MRSLFSFCLCAIAAWGTLTPSTAKGVVTEPDDFSWVALTHTHVGRSGDPALLSFGSIAGDRVLTYNDAYHGMPSHFFVGSGAVDPIYIDYDGNQWKPWACLWGGEYLFCQAEADVGGRPSDAIFALHYQSKTILAHGFSLGELQPGGHALKGAFDGSVVVEDKNQGIHLLTVTGGALKHDRLAAGGYDHSPVIGRGGGEFPSWSRETYVVWQERGKNGWILRSWDVDQGRVVAEVDAGPNPPNPSDLFGYAFLSMDDTIKKWDPSEPSNPDGPVMPNPIQDTPMEPAYHNCRALQGMKAGGNFGLVVGQGCSNADGLFLVARDDGNFVVDWSRMIYQPFDTVMKADYFALENELMAYVESGSMDVHLFEVDLERVMPTRARTSPWDNNAGAPVALAPWNVGSWGTGSIDYDSGGRYHDWKVFLSPMQTYRVVVVSTDHSLCGDGAWYYDTRMTISSENGNLFRIVDDNETSDHLLPKTCAGIEFSPEDHGGHMDYTIRVDRPYAGPAGFPLLPLNYMIYIEVL